MTDIPTHMHPLATAVLVTRETLLLNPLRGMLSTLGVIIGVGSLVAVLSLGDGMERTAREQLEQTTDLQSVAVESRASEEIDGQTFAVADTVPITMSDLADVAAIAGVSSAGLLARAPVEVRSSDLTTRRMAELTAAGAEIAQLQSLKLAAGRMPVAADTFTDTMVAVVSRQLARDLVGDSASRALGVTILVNGQRTRIVGVLQGELGRASRTLIVPYVAGMDSVLQRRVLRYPALIAHAARIEDVPSIERAVKGLFRSRQRSGRLPYIVQTYGARADQASQGILIFKLLMGAITGISLVVGGIGIMNVLLASVTERTREIGIRKAAGARDRDIFLQFLAESMAISGIGGLMRVLLGLGVSFGLTSLIRHYANAIFIRASFGWGSVVVAALLSMLIGLVFGTYPARRAASLSPIDAIRYE